MFPGIGWGCREPALEEADTSGDPSAVIRAIGRDGQ